MIARSSLGVLLTMALTACAPLGSGGPGVPQSAPGRSGGPSDVQVAAALREALHVATDHAVRSTGRLDGYLGNQAIRIVMPENLRALERGLRAAGQGQLVDEFVLGMNRAAEQAAPAARGIFWDAIRDLTFGDARRILGGDDTAATEYFRERTTDRLTVAFQPAVAQALDEVGVTRQYRAVLGLAQRIPAVRLEAFDLDRYVVAKALDGLFLVISQEERRIRRDPAARVTALLQEVFGRL
jgi:Protein of unknown function (DUF4197)